MSSKLKKVLQLVVFAMIGLGLLWYILRKQDINQLKDTISHAKIQWLLAGLFLNVLSNVIRAHRWNMTLEPLGYRPRLIVSWLIVQIGYAANLAIPRVGEAGSRSALMLQYEGVPVDKSLGTMVTDRIIDMVMLLLVVPIALILDYRVFISFLEQLHWGSTQKLIQLAIIAIFAGIAGVFVIIYVFKKYKANPLIAKINNFLMGFVSGLASVAKVKQPGWYIFHTILMWVLYWLTSYIMFWCFGFTEHLTLTCALVLLATGTFGFVAPVNGGIGAYEFIAIATLQLYGITYQQASAYSLLNHLGTLMLQIVLAIMAIIVLGRFYKKKDLKTTHIV